MGHSVLRPLLGVLVLMSLSRCTGGDGGPTRVDFYAIDGEEIAPDDRRVIRAIALETVAEARQYLPQLPTPLIIRVQPGHDVMAETGASGTAEQPNLVMWTVDPDHPGGVQKAARAWLRPGLLHELHHLARGTVGRRDSLLDNAITEGLAIAFERDVSGVKPPWGAYPEGVEAWVEEVRDLPGDSETRRTWLGRHPDGRRWVVRKAGTFLVDRAMAGSGRSAAELATTSTAEVMRLAEGGASLPGSR